VERALSDLESPVETEASAAGETAPATADTPAPDGPES